MVCTTLSSGNPAFHIGVYARARSAVPVSWYGECRVGRGHRHLCVGRMMHRILVENWEAERAVEEKGGARD